MLSTHLYYSTARQKKSCYITDRKAQIRVYPALRQTGLQNPAAPQKGAFPMNGTKKQEPGQQFTEHSMEVTT